MAEVEVCLFENGVAKDIIKTPEFQKVLEADDIDDELRKVGYEETMHIGDTDLGPCLRVFIGGEILPFTRKYLIEIFITEDSYSYWFCDTFKDFLDFLTRYGSFFQIMELNERIADVLDSASARN